MCRSALLSFFIPLLGNVDRLGEESDLSSSYGEKLCDSEELADSEVSVSYSLYIPTPETSRRKRRKGLGTNVNKAIVPLYRYVHPLGRSLMA